ncbi:LacI family DNA-binding transcriptional regulator [Plantibacter sp. M259]|uniref:LacI family DNA-binding transcriptional regulator n=1 Tax=Plantibacter sp. M259 TaxID=2583822 RepID=UPI001F1027DE|nr:LacI family DNA-binding transcriptional regulator [Plantibacter sp. M259]
MDQESRPSRPTLADVAERAGVSPSTASLAFSGAGPVSEATKQRVLQAAADLDYAGPDPRARSLRQGRSGIVGAVVAGRIGHSFRDPVMVQTLDGLADELGAVGAGLLLLNDAQEGTLQLSNAPMDGVVLIGCSPNLDSSVAILSRRGMPIVSIEGLAALGVPDIAVDNRGGVREEARHLADLGHERVAVVTLNLDPTERRGPLTPEWERSATTVPAIERLQGLRDVFPDAQGFVTTGSSLEEGRVAGHAILDVPADERPTAIAAQSDLLAAGVIRAAEELGISVPAELSVVGFDGIRVEGLDYDLTTVWQPSREKGSAAGRAIVAMLDGRDPECERFSVRFHPGATTARVPAPQR